MKRKHYTTQGVPGDHSAKPSITPRARYICGHVSCIGVRREIKKKKVNPMLAAFIESRQVLMHLHRPHTAAWTAVGASRLAKKHHHDPRALALIGAEEKTQPLLLLLLPLWQPQQTTPRSMAEPMLRCRAVNLCLTSDRCATAVHHCANPQRAAPGLVCSQTPRKANRRPCGGSISQSVYLALGVRSRRLGRSDRRLFGAWHHNIFTADFCLSGHSTKCASCSTPLRRASIGNGRRGESRSDALSLDHRLVNQDRRLRDPPGAFDEWADLFSQLDSSRTPSHTHTHTPTRVRG